MISQAVDLKVLTEQARVFRYRVSEEVEARAGLRSRVDWAAQCFFCRKEIRWVGEKVLFIRSIENKIESFGLGFENN